MEPAAWPVIRGLGIRCLALTVGPDHRLARGADRARAAVVADRHIFVVGEQRIVGPELLADVRGMMNADVKVGEVADETRHVQPHLCLADQLRLNLVAVLLVGK